MSEPDTQAKFEAALRRREDARVTLETAQKALNEAQAACRIAKDEVIRTRIAHLNQTYKKIMVNHKGYVWFEWVVQETDEVVETMNSDDHYTIWSRKTGNPTGPNVPHLDLSQI